MKAIQCDYCGDFICKGEPVYRSAVPDESIYRVFEARYSGDRAELDCEICAMRFGEDPDNIKQILGDDYDALPWVDELILDE